MTLANGSESSQPRGWTFDIGVPDIIASYTSAEGLALYRALLDEDPGVAQRFRRAGGGLLYCGGLTGDAALSLLEELPVASLDDRQNESPTLGAFLRAAAAHPGQVELIGYCVGPDRADELFSVDGVLIYNDDWDFRIQEEWDTDPLPEHEPWCECAALWTRAQWEYGLTDALCFTT